MKIGVKVAAFFTALLIALSCCFVGCSSPTDDKSASFGASFNDMVEFLPMTADGGISLTYNPDRGFRSGCGFDVAVLAKNYSYTEIKSKVFNVLTMYVFNLRDNTKVVNIGYNLSGYHDTKQLPQEALDVFRAVSDFLRIKKIKQSVNFLYNGKFYVAWTTSQEAKTNTASVCASQEVMLAHIDQLASVVTEYKDTVFSIMGGFIGFSGDMGESTQYPPVDRNTVMKAVIEKLAVPNDIYYLIRSPEHKYYLAEEDPYYAYLDRISFVNKAMFGEQTKTGWNSGGYQKGNPEGFKVDWWEYVTKEALYAPNDAELFPNSHLIAGNNYPVSRLPSGLEIILECAHHGMTTMGIWNGYYEVDRANAGPAAMDLWLEETITPAVLEANNIVYDPAWFTDDLGNSVGRNAFDFIRDHLGYKIVAESADIKSDGNSISVDMKLCNYGFSAAYNLESGFAILNDKYEVVTSVQTGHPDKWYSHDPEDATSTVVPEYNISAKLDSPSDIGKFYVAFYLKNSMNDFAQLSNRELPFESGYNILYEFENK